MSHINNFLFMLDYRTEQRLNSVTREHYLISLFSFCCFITILIVLFFISRFENGNYLYVSSLEAEVAEKTASLTEKKSTARRIYGFDGKNSEVLDGS